GEGAKGMVLLSGAGGTSPEWLFSVGDGTAILPSLSRRGIQLLLAGVEFGIGILSVGTSICDIWDLLFGTSICGIWIFSFGISACVWAMRMLTCCWRVGVFICKEGDLPQLSR